MRVPQVLLVERTTGLLGLWGEELSGVARCHMANSPERFLEFFGGLKEHLDLIVFGNDYIGGCTSDQLIEHVRAESYTGPIFVCTALCDARKRQLRAGGENAFAVEKRHVAEEARKLLGLTEPTPASA